MGIYSVIQYTLEFAAVDRRSWDEGAGDDEVFCSNQSRLIMQTFS